MDKEDVVYICNGILLSHKKEWNIAICNNMDGPKEYHTKWSQTKTNIICCHMWNLKYIQMSSFTKQKQTHRHIKQTYGYQRGKGGGIN